MAAHPSNPTISAKRWTICCSPGASSTSGSWAGRKRCSTDDHRFAPRRFRYQDGLRRLNHEEAMRCVAPELFDQAIFPIKIGLHRVGPDVGALVGTPVAMRRIRLWQFRWRLDLQRAVIAAIEHVGFPPHLREPGRRHVGAHTHIVREQDARPAHRCGHVDLLDKLPSRLVAKTRAAPAALLLPPPNPEPT